MAAKAEAAAAARPSEEHQRRLFFPLCLRTNPRITHSTPPPECESKIASKKIPGGAGRAEREKEQRASAPPAPPPPSLQPAAATNSTAALLSPPPHPLHARPCPPRARYKRPMGVVGPVTAARGPPPGGGAEKKTFAGAASALPPPLRDLLFIILNAECIKKTMELQGFDPRTSRRF